MMFPVDLGMQEVEWKVFFNMTLILVNLIILQD